jgi:signal transduction histidine kinase
MDQAPLQEIDIHTGIESTLTIMGYKLRKNNINVEREFAPNLPKVCAYGSELNQVWTNLIDNAADAMNGGGTGEKKLHIRTVQEGICVRVEIGDTGDGIPPGKLQRIFEPFFTTKGVGEGSGLGLDTVRRIVDKHQGSIRVESKPGDTRFVVLIPIRN